jgi:hypothetical protein
MANRTFRPRYTVRARWTILDDCGVVAYDGDPDACVVYVRDCLVSYTWEDQFEDPQEFLVMCDNGRPQYYDRTDPTYKFTAGTLSVNDVDPLLNHIMMASYLEEDAQTQDVVGYRPSATGWGTSKFALELWAALSTPSGAQACPAGVQEWAYLLFPFNRNGRWATAPTASNNTDATQITFDTMTGGAWEDGPFNVVPDETGAASPLIDPITGDQPYLIRRTSIAPPDVTDGCVPLAAPVSS